MFIPIFSSYSTRSPFLKGNVSMWNILYNILYLKEYVLNRNLRHSLTYLMLEKFASKVNIKPKGVVGMCVMLTLVKLI